MADDAATLAFIASLMREHPNIRQQLAAAITNPTPPPSQPAPPPPSHTAASATSSTPFDAPIAPLTFATPGYSASQPGSSSGYPPPPPPATFQGHPVGVPAPAFQSFSTTFTPSPSLHEAFTAGHQVASSSRSAAIQRHPRINRRGPNIAPVGLQSSGHRQSTSHPEPIYQNIRIKLLPCAVSPFFVAGLSSTCSLIKASI